jgi:hypothetical protein
MITNNIRKSNNCLDIFIYDKGKREITLIEVGLTWLDKLQTIEIEERKYV